MITTKSQSFSFAWIFFLSLLFIQASGQVQNKDLATPQANFFQEDTINILEKRKATLLQEWAQHRQKPYDPVTAARLALHGFMQNAPSRLPGIEGYCRPNFDSNLLPQPKCEHGQWDCGDCTARSLLAWANLREITGDLESGMEVEQSQENFLLSMLHPETGLAFVPDMSDPSQDKYYYHIWDQSRTLRALVGWYEKKPDDRVRLKPYIGRMIAGLERFATKRGVDEKWGPFAGFTNDEFLNDKSLVDDGFVKMRGGICVEPLVQWAEITADSKALDLASRFVSFELGGHGGDTLPAESKSLFRFEADGSFGGHLHSKTSTLIGVARLGRYLINNGKKETGIQLLKEARKSYEWLFTVTCGANRIGWVPEHPGALFSETCCAADAMELAGVLASCANLSPDLSDWSGLYDDLESMAVNIPARTQLRFTPDFEAFLQASYGAEANQKMEIARRFDGTWSSSFYPNDLVRPDGLLLTGCCQFSGVTTLYSGWQNSMKWEASTLFINYFMNRTMPEAEMSTNLPFQGYVKVTIMKKAKVVIRIPFWLDFDDVRFKNNGRNVNVAEKLEAGSRYAILESVRAGSVLEINFPLQDRITTESIGGENFTVKWRGNYVWESTSVGESLPLFPKITSKTDQLYNPYWAPGYLDPSRSYKWTEPKQKENKLELINIKPEYISLIIEGDRTIAGDFHYFKPNIRKDGSILIGAIEKYGGGMATVEKNKRVTLFIDFGRVYPGTVELEAEIPDGVKVSFETGEALLPKQKYSSEFNSVGSLNKIRPVINRGGWAGMRYVWIHFDNIPKQFPVFEIKGLCQIRPSNYQGSFNCSDEMLDRIWEMSAWSVHAVMGQPLDSKPDPSGSLQTLLMDREDRFPWAGDSRVIQSGVSYVFGEYDLIRTANEYFIPLGTRPIPILTGLPPYTLDWALAVIDYYRVSGDDEHMRKRIDDLLAVMEKFDPYTEMPSGRYFFDWDKRISYNVHEHSEVPTQSSAAYLGKYIQMCREAAWAAGYVGNHEAALRFTGSADRLINKWSHDNTDWKSTYDLHAITNLILGEVLESGDYPYAYDKVYADRILRCTNTPYFGYYVLNALAKMNRHKSAVQMLRDYWGTMIQAGATTVWEEWDPTSKLPVNSLPPQYGPPDTWSGLSLCQPAGAGPAQWLIREILGISPSEPGFRSVIIEPHIANLQWANGSASSPLGLIKSGWHLDGKNLSLNFSVPDKCQGVTIILPKSKTYKLNGKRVTPVSFKNGKAVFYTSSGKHIFTCENLIRKNGDED